MISKTEVTLLEGYLGLFHTQELFYYQLGHIGRRGAFACVPVLKGADRNLKDP